MEQKSVYQNGIVTFGGICFFLSALLQIVTAFGPPLAGDIEFLDWVLEQPGYTLFFTFTLLAFSLFNIPALIAITHRIHGRGAGLAYTGAIIALMGNSFYAILGAEALIQRGMATLEREPMIALLNWIFETPIYAVPHFLLFLLSYTGILLITIGLFRGGIAPAWIIVAGALHFITGFLGLGPYVQSVIILITFGGIGWTLLNKSQGKHEIDRDTKMM